MPYLIKVRFIAILLLLFLLESLGIGCLRMAGIDGVCSRCLMAAEADLTDSPQKRSINLNPVLEQKIGIDAPDGTEKSLIEYLHRTLFGCPYYSFILVLVVVLLFVTVALLVIIRNKNIERDRLANENEIFFKTLVDDAPVFIVKALPDGTITNFNPAFARFLSVNEGVEFNLRDHLEKNNYEKFILLFNTMTTTNPVATIEISDSSADGDQCDLRWVLRGVFDDNGLVCYCLGIGEDISGIRRAYRALETNENKFRTVADFTYDWESWLSPEGEILYISPSCERISGYTIEDFQANPDLFSLRVIPADRNIYDRYMRSPEEFHHMQYRFKRKDQSFVWIEHISRPVRSRKNIPLGVRVSRRDITARKKAEDALRDNEEILRTTMQSISEGVITLNLKREVINMNSAAESLVGLHLSEAIGKTVQGVLQLCKNYSDKQFLEVGTIIKKLVTTKGVTSDSLNSYILKSVDGNKVFDISMTCSYLQNSYGETVGLVLVLSDITHKNALESQLRHTQKMEAIGQLAGGIAHDFNNMVSGIIGAAELIQMKNDEDSASYRHAETIIRVGENAAKMTKQLLTFARKDNINAVAVEANGVINDAIEMLSRSISRDIVLTTDYCSEKCNVIADKSQLENVVINLVLNARDAMPEGGKITVTTRRIKIDSAFCAKVKETLADGEYVRIDVTDNGIGIEKGILEKVFDPFFTTKDVDKGTGLGLSVTYGIIRSFSGAIIVESTVGEGTTFSVFIPCCEQEAVKENITFKSVSFNNVTVLLVDDEGSVLSTSSQILASHGFNVLKASDGAEAVEIFRDHHEDIDVVVMDVIMPVLDGQKAFYKMKKIDPGLKVILSSGYTKENNLQELYDAGVLSFLRKPYRQQELLNILSQVLGQE